ncbi:oligogalacturonate-specific porin KdgM family protein [Vibrio salinus]|uniref:oligogalacturonate-specific porin KdgM family protein n=1 Tax=Vibrio salinus TaxID=2899784 RepID=UPI001E622E59|nr:oligogalacturonate-specific porin KdgM family protein [Vibrio salinus]MCE0496050.1 oligogalacturonate-specific porin KdgM family protein [Vibrio salinus]
MKNKILVSAVLLGLTSTAVSAATLNIREEFTPRYDSQSAAHKQRVAVDHRFKNGVGFGVEVKWKGDNEDAFGEQKSNGHQANISYLYKLNDKWSLKPQYKWESNSTQIGHQLNLTLGYKVNSDWAVSFRHRYHYDNPVPSKGKTNSHYNRWTFAFGYSGIEDWKFGGSLDYTFNSTEKGPRWKDHKAWFSELNFTGEYKGFESGWRPFMEVGFVPYKSGQEYDFNGTTDAQNDKWRPRFRVGLKYNF